MANDLIRIRRDIYTNWTAANPVLALGEISYDLTNDEIRVGDGTTAWLSLPAVGSANLSDGSKGDIVVSSGGTVWSLSSALVAEIAAKLEASDLNLGTSTTPATTPLQIRRGNTLSWTGVVLQAGEIGFDSQLNEIRIGDGITDWDNLDPVGLNKLQNLSLEQIGDVVIANLTPGDVLIHDGTNWINQQIQFPATDLDDLTSVTLGSPTLGQVLTFNGTVWINSTPSVLSAGVKNDINVVSDTNWQIVDDSVTQAKLNLDLPVNPWDAATKDYTDTTVGLGVMSIEDQFGQPNGPALLDSTRKIGTGFLATGTASSTTFLRGDRTWATVDSGIPVGVKNDITVVAADDWQITANSIETTMLKASSVNAAKIGGTGISAFGKLLLNIAAPGDQQVPLYDENEGAWVPTSINDLIGPVALDTVVGIKDVSGGLLGISNQGLVDPSFLSSGYESISRQVLGNTSWIPEDLYKNPTTDTVAYTDGRSLGTWSLSSLTSGSVIFDNTAIISALAETANSNAAIKLPTTITANDKSLEFTARVRVRGASMTPNTNYVVGLYEMSTGVERYAAVVARDNVSTWTTVAKPDSGTSGTSTSTAISCLAWTDVKITIKNNEIKMYINGTLVSTTATTAFVGLPLSLGCAVFCEAATAPQAELEVEYMRVSNTDGQLIHPRMIEQAGATTGQVLSWSGSTWQPAAGGVGGATNLDGLSDVVITDPAQGNFLWYDTGAWKNSYFTLDKALDVATLTPGNEQALIYDSGDSQWKNRTVLSLDRLTFNTAPPSQSALVGNIYYDQGTSSLVTPLSGNVLAELGKTSHTRVLNKTGNDILKGRVVRVTGSQGQKITVALANASSETTAATTIGISAELIADDAEAFIITEGLLRGINTNLLVKGTTPEEGDPLWLNTVNGEMTVDRPVAPNHGVFLGWLIRLGNGSSGEIFVRVINGSELNELHDVLITTPITGNVLRYTGTVWANAALAIADVTSLQGALDGKAATTHSHAIGDVTGLQGALDGKAAASHTHAAGDIITGTIATARLGSGTANNTTFLRGDNTWQTVSSGATNLDSLSDVTVATPTTGQTLKYNGTVWSNSNINLTDITDLQSPTNGQILAVSSGAWTATTLNNVAEVAKLNPIGITPSAAAGRILLTSLLDGSGASVQETVHGNFIDTATIDATFEDRSVGTPTGIAKWKFDVKDSSIGTTKLGGDITTAGKALLDDTDAAAQRTTLGLGTAATSNTSAFAAASHTHAAGDITTGTIAPARLGSGTADSTTFLRGDNTWQTVSGGGATNLDGLSDVVITTPASNNLLGYNGSSWVNRAVNDAIGDATLGVGKLSQGTATNGQVLAWNNIASSWAPADPSGGGATPQGSDGAIQYNSAGSFEGATSTLISANGNIQLNDSTESTGIANSTILFSKSFAGRSLPTIRSGSACPDTNLQICIGRNRIAWANFSGASTTLSAFGIALSTTGTAAAGTLTVSGGTQLGRQMRTTYSNTAAINAFVGVRTGSSQVWRGTVANSGGFHIVYRFGRSDAITLCSEYHGVSSTTSAPGAGQVDPTALNSYVNKFGIGLRTTDTNYQLMHCNGTAVATVVDTGIAAVQNVSYRLELFWEPGNSSVMKWLLVREDNDTSATGSASTNLPAQNTALCFTSHRCTVNNNAVVTHNFISYYHEQIGLQ
jgi:hypothetical protein